MDRIDRDRLFIPAIRGNDCAPLDLRLPAWFGSFSTHGLSHLFRRILAAPSRSPAAARESNQDGCATLAVYTYDADLFDDNSMTVFFRPRLE
jgi:hypothetical protein